MSGEKHEIGIICSRCAWFNVLGSGMCDNCHAGLSARGGDPLTATDAYPQAELQSIEVPHDSGDALTLGADEESPMDASRHYVCRSCSSAVPAGHKFCGRCGSPIPVEVRELRTNYFGDMQNTSKAKLILIRGEGMDGLSFHLKAEQHIVGREGQLIFPDDPFVSPRHANFFYRDGALVVRDEGSLNGVYIRIRGAIPFEPGSTFLAGEQLFRLEKLGDIEDDGPAEDGTTFYASPKKESAFRLCQVFRGGAIGMTVHAAGEHMTVGRDGADLNFPEDLFMSGEHCRITHEDGSFTLTDLDSRNGTYVRIQKERPLEHGDYVFIGRKLLRVELNTN